MRITTIEKWISGIGIVAIAGGTFWLGRLDNRVEQLEKSSVWRIGSRGENCQQIVGKLVDRPTDKELKALAEQWGCANMAASFKKADETKLCPDGTVVGKAERCAEPPSAEEQ